MWPIVFWTFHAIYIACKSGMFLLPAILALGNSRIHVGPIYCSDIAFDIEVPID